MPGRSVAAVLEHEPQGQVNRRPAPCHVVLQIPVDSLVSKVELRCQRHHEQLQIRISQPEALGQDRERATDFEFGLISRGSVATSFPGQQFLRLALRHVEPPERIRSPGFWPRQRQGSGQPGIEPAQRPRQSPTGVQVSEHVMLSRLRPHLSHPVVPHRQPADPAATGENGMSSPPRNAAHRR